MPWADGDRGGPALRGASLVVRAGEIVAVAGVAGNGQRELAETVAGMRPATGGTIRIAGRAIRGGDPRAAIDAGIGVVYQHFMLVGPLTVWENAVLGREPRRLGFIDRRRSRREAADVAARLGLAIDVDARVETLSVAAQQRVEILKQLWRGARALILDEPTALLSPQESAELMRTVRALAAEGRAVLFISHKLREVLAVADRIVALYLGRTAAQVKATDITHAQIVELITAGRSGDLGLAPATAAIDLGEVNGGQ